MDHRIQDSVLPLAGQTYFSHYLTSLDACKGLEEGVPIDD